MVAAALMAATTVGCSDDKKSATSTTRSSEGTTTTAAPRPTVSADQEDLITFAFADDAVNFRGGKTTAKALSEVKPEAKVETPMPVEFGTSVDKVLSDKARNQVKLIVANATDERGSRPRVDPVRVQRNAEDNVAIMVVIDNPTDTAITEPVVRADLLKGGTESVAKADFKIPASEVKEIPPNTAVFLVLEMSKERLGDFNEPLETLSLRLDLLT